MATKDELIGVVFRSEVIKNTQLSLLVHRLCGPYELVCWLEKENGLRS